jgi:hypothetical protein
VRGGASTVAKNGVRARAYCQLRGAHCEHQAWAIIVVRFA